MERTMVTQLASAVTLTASSTACTNKHEAGGYGQHSLYITYNPGTNSTNALEVTIELSPDGGTTWYPYTGEYSGATGTITPGTQVTLSFASSGTTAQYEDAYFFVGSALTIRIKASETNTPGTYGTYTAWLVSSHP